MRVTLGADFREAGGNVDAELVGRGILTGVVAALAVVAEVGEVVEVPLGEVAPELHGGEDGAEAFAVAAGVADFHGAAGVLGGLSLFLLDEI